MTEPYADSLRHIQELNNEIGRITGLVDDLDQARNIWALLAHNLADALKCGCTGHTCLGCEQAVADYQRFKNK